MTRAVLYDMDPELGILRWCRACREWWPYDSEFWWYPNEPGRRAFCKADHRRQGRLGASRKRASVHAVVRPPHPCARCLSVLTHNRECHGCAGRYAGPLTGARLASFGLAGGVN